MMKRFKQMFLYVVVLVVLFGFVGADSEAADKKKPGPADTAVSPSTPAAAVLVGIPVIFQCPRDLELGQVGGSNIWTPGHVKSLTTKTAITDFPGKQRIECLYYSATSMVNLPLAELRAFVPSGSCAVDSEGIGPGFKCKPGTTVTK
jgi:hypothetical protein